MSDAGPELAYREFAPPLGIGESFSQHHIKARAADVARYVLMPGSHSRGRLIAERLEHAQLVAATRGYYVYTGVYHDTRLTVCSTGMGGPAVAIAMEELGRLGADTFIRVGSCGGWQPFLRVGDVVVATATARYGGTTRWYMPIEFPAVADHAVTHALIEAGHRLRIPLHHGICAARDAFYVDWDPAVRDRLERAGVLVSEMEADTVFVVGSTRGWRCGAAFVVASSADHAVTRADGQASLDSGERTLVDVALEAVADLGSADS